MNLEIRVKSISDENKGKYNQLSVGYLDINSGQEHTYKLMSFINKDAYNLLKAAKADDEFHVVCNKNDKGYWTWEEVTVLGSQVKTVKTNATPRSTYETPEERAKKQLYIVRQSSIASAVSLMAAFPKEAPKDTPVGLIAIALAKKFEAYVFGLNDEQVSFEAEQLPTTN